MYHKNIVFKLFKLKIKHFQFKKFKKRLFLWYSMWKFVYFLLFQTKNGQFSDFFNTKTLILSKFNIFSKIQKISLFFFTYFTVKIAQFWAKSRDLHKFWILNSKMPIFCNKMCGNFLFFHILELKTRKKQIFTLSNAKIG